MRSVHLFYDYFSRLFSGFIPADYFMVLSITGEKTHADHFFGYVQLDLFNTSLRFVLNLRASHSGAPYFFILVFLIFLSRFFSASLHNW